VSGAFWIPFENYCVVAEKRGDDYTVVSDPVLAGAKNKSRELGDRTGPAFGTISWSKCWVTMGGEGHAPTQGWDHSHVGRVAYKLTAWHYSLRSASKTLYGRIVELKQWKKKRHTIAIWSITKDRRCQLSISSQIIDKLCYFSKGCKLLRCCSLNWFLSLLVLFGIAIYVIKFDSRCHKPSAVSAGHWIDPRITKKNKSLVHAAGPRTPYPFLQKTSGLWWRFVTEKKEWHSHRLWYHYSRTKREPKAI